jgi:aryl-alcohol dehydrogenase-like predicted oxidoreductase
MSSARRPLGGSGLSIGPFALGGNVFGWTVGEAEGFRLLDAFVDAGFNLIDTADTYSIWVPGHQGGESETIIGSWLRRTGRRDEVVLATKVGMDMGSGGTGLSTEHIRRSIDASLRRLRTDRIDLYQAHADDPGTPLEETLGTLDGLVREGKALALGASNYSAKRLSEALRCSAERGFARFESMQPRYNLLDRADYEGDLEKVCVGEGLGVIAYSSLASGFLTGKYRSKADLGKSPRGARAEARMNERGFRVLAALDEIATRLDSSPATVALAWLMGRRGVTAPIASATSVPQLRQLLAATSLNLDAASRELLERAGADLLPGGQGQR